MKSKQKLIGDFSIGKFLLALLSITALISFTALAVSAAMSGYHYQFDIDELLYAQCTYLYAQGLRPYLDVYISVHPAVFGWVMMPVFWLKGFTFDALYLGRAAMILLLMIRLASAWYLLRIILTKRTAFLFLFLFLFDPFAVFTSMQFRPDNLMLTLYTAGLLFFTLGITRNAKFFPVAGLLLGSTIVVLPKTVPSLLVLGIIFVIYCLSRRRLKDSIVLMFWGIVPSVLYCLYLLTQGSFHEMVLQTFIESQLLFSNYTYQVPINSLMRPDNAWIFGSMGKPATWVYLWLIAPIGLTGVYHAFHRILEKGRQSAGDVVIIILGVTFLVQWALLFALQVAFMQHYMPLNWLGAVFGAYTIDQLLIASRHHRFMYPLLVLFFIIAFAWITKTSINNNYARATITGEPTIDSFKARWLQIPPSQAVFPGFLFRPSSYPIPYGGFIGDIPKTILDRLPDIATTIETSRPQVLMDEYTLNHLPDDALLYVRDNYTHVAGDSELMVRK